MEFNEFLQLLRRKKQTIITLVLIGTMLVTLVSLINPLKYGVTSRLLVTQDSSNSDAYSLSRSNEYLGNLLSQVVYSGSFYDKVLESRYDVNKSYFGGDYGKQMKKWKNTINTRTRQDAGIIEVNIYHTDILEAKKIALAVNHILINENQDYHGGRNIKINVIDQPLASNYPVKPNVLYNAGLAAGIALLFALFYIYIFPEEKYSIYLFSTSKKKPKPKKMKDIKERKDSTISTDKKEIVLEKRRDKEEDEEDEDIDIDGNIANIIK